MGFEVDIRFQIVELCVMFILIVDYMRRKKLPLTTTKFFSAMLFIGFVYLIADVLSVVTIYNYTDTILNEIVHRIFYLLLITVSWSFSAYVELSGNSSVDMNPKQAIRWTIWLLPYLLSVIGIFTLPIYYSVTDVGVYSYGPAANGIMYGLVFYVIATFIATFYYRKVIPKRNLIAVRFQMIIWCVAMGIRFLDPYILTTGMVLTLSYLILYLSFENQELFIDELTNTFNQKAFILSFTETCHSIIPRQFYLVSIVIDDREALIASIGSEKYEKVFSLVVDRVSSETKYPIYRITNQAIVVRIPHSKEKLTSFIGFLEEHMHVPFMFSGNSMDIATHVLVMDCPEVFSDASHVIDCVMNEGVGENPEYVRYVTDDFHEKNHRKSVILGLVKHAVENDGLEVFYQPIYSVKEKQFVSAEALVRLKDNKTLGFVSPEEFIPLAEKGGYILKLGEQVFEKTCDTIAELREKMIPVEYMEVNVSTLQIIDDSVLERFLYILQEKGIDANALNLEITETAAISSSRLMQKNMEAFSTAGCTFSMDDFGTGYSNLANMIDSNFDIVKLDKSLIWPCFSKEGETEKAKVILQNSISMLKQLGFKIVAEGVETKEMVDMLVECGVDYLQGYYFSKPVNKEDYISYLSKNKSLAI